MRETMRELPAEKRRSMDYSIAEGFFTTVATQFAGGFLTPFALGFGATKSQVSLLNVIPNAMSNAMQAFAYRLTSESKSRRRVVLLGMTATRLLWIPMALVPFFTTSHNGVYWLLGIQFLIALSQSFTIPPWTSIMADLVPREIRGRFFASRNIIMNLGAVAAAAIAGRFIAIDGFPRGYQLGILVYLVLGMASVVCFSKVQVPPQPEASARSTHERLPLFKTALNLKTPFSKYVSVICLHSFGVGLVSSLFGVYMLQDLGGTVAHIGYMASTSTVASIIGQRFWGTVIDRRGEKFVMNISAFTIACVPVVWLLARNPWHAILANVFGGLAWSGWNLGTFNMLILLSPESQKQGYIAVGNSVPAIFGVLSPLIAGPIADAIGIRPLLFASATGRFLAAVVFRFAVPREPVGEGAGVVYGAAATGVGTGAKAGRSSSRGV